MPCIPLNSGIFQQWDQTDGAERFGDKTQDMVVRKEKRTNIWYFDVDSICILAYTNKAQAIPERPA